MTKTTCPTCGAKCEQVTYSCESCETHHKINRLVSLPHPDLTKLRKIMNNYNPENDDPDFPVTSWYSLYVKFYDVIKEVLDENRNG